MNSRSLRFSQLLHNPESIGISRHIEMQDLTHIVADNEKAIQNTKGERWDGKDRARQNLEEGEPKMRR